MKSMFEVEATELSIIVRSELRKNDHRRGPSRAICQHRQIGRGSVYSASLRHVFFLLLVLCAILPGRLRAQEATDILQILERTNGSTGIWGAVAADVASGEVLFSVNGSTAFIPASNQKLITTATALDALGSSYRYRTRVYFHGEVRGDELRGDIIVRGAGDPTFGSVEIRAGNPLRDWARQLASMGVRRFEGRLIGDDDVFDDRPYAEGWDVDYITRQSSSSLGISAGGLSFNDNVVRVQITSSRPGEAPKVTSSPSGYLNIQNNAQSSGRRRGWAVRVDRDFGSETVVLTGSVPQRYQGTIVVPVSNPTTFTMHTFGQELVRAGIEVEAAVVDVDDLEDAPDYERATLLFVHLSPPLSQIISILNKESNNFYAEQVFRTFGWGGTTEGSERRAKELLSRAGVQTDRVSIRDGSGLSRKNLITPMALARLLVYMSTHAESEAFLSSLAEGGEARTTLRGRLHGIPVRAKTGSLEFVRTLGGYTQTADGRPIAFAVFANNFTGPAYAMTQTIDQVIAALASAQ